MADNIKEVDLVGIVREIWRRKWKAVKYGIGGLIVGIVVVIFTPTRYTTGSVFVAQIDASSLDLSNLGGLAAMAGVSSPLAGRSPSTLSPRLYPQVISSSAFLKELMYTKVNTKKSPVPVTLSEYLTNPAYQGFSLGKLISGIMPHSKPGVDSLPAVGAGHDILELSPKEAAVAGALKGMIGITLDTKNGSIAVSVTMPEALVAAEVASTVVNMLQRYITDFKLEKANQKLAFIQERYNEIKADYYGKLASISTYRDAHRNISTEVGRIQEQKMSDEYNIAYVLFNDISGQLEQAKLDVKKDTPIFTIVDPITIPTRPTAPRRLRTPMIFAVLGGLIMVGQVVIAQMRKKEDEDEA